MVTVTLLISNRDRVTGPWARDAVDEPKGVSRSMELAPSPSWWSCLIFGDAQFCGAARDVVIGGRMDIALKHQETRVLPVLRYPFQMELMVMG